HSPVNQIVLGHLQGQVETWNPIRCSVFEDLATDNALTSAGIGSNGDHSTRMQQAIERSVNFINPGSVTEGTSLPIASIQIPLKCCFDESAGARRGLGLGDGVKDSRNRLTGGL